MGISAQRAAAAGLKLNPTPPLLLGVGAGELGFPGDLGERQPLAREGAEIWEAGEKKLFYPRLLEAEERGWDGGEWEMGHDSVISGCEILISGREGIYLVCGIGAFPCLCAYMPLHIQTRIRVPLIFLYTAMSVRAGVCRCCWGGCEQQDACVSILFPRIILTHVDLITLGRSVLHST